MHTTRTQRRFPREKIEVVAYSGYRGEETPRALRWFATMVEVAEICSRWVEEGVGDRDTKRGFKVIGINGNAYSLIYDELTREWICESEGDGR